MFRGGSRSRGWLIGGLILATLTLAGLWLKRDHDRALRQRRVISAIASQRLDLARIELDRWLGAEPGSPQAHFLNARLAWSRNDLATVDRELNQARALGYSGPDFDRAWGLFLARGGRKREAESILKQAIAIAPDGDPEAAEALARLYLGEFRLEEAGQVLDEWARTTPTDPRPLLSRAEVDLRLSARPEVVIDRYKAALDRDPGLPAARLGLAEQLRLNQRFQEATVHYERYLESRPDDPTGLLGAGQNALELGDLDQAARLIDRALARAPRDPVALAARATVETRRGQFESAIPYLDQAEAADPFDIGIRYQRMIVLTRLGRRREADDERKAMEKIKEDQAWFSRVSLELRHNPTDLTLRAQAARWLMEHGHEQEAVEWANLVLHEQPDHPGINRIMADYYRRKGQIGLANLHETHAAPATREEPRP